MINMADFHLKSIREADLKLVYSWRNSVRIRSFMYTDHPITWEEHCRWFEHQQGSADKKVLLLYLKNNPIGLVNITNMDKKHSRVFWGFYIGETDAPKGSGTIMGILALDKLFNEMNFNKVCAEVIHTNTRSLRYHRKLGFETEGRFVDHIWKDNQYLDVIPMALFRKKWTHVKTELLTGLGVK